MNLVPVIAFSTSIITTSAAALPPLRDVPEIDDSMLWVALAVEISDRCESIEPRTFRGLTYLWQLKSRAAELGYSDADIEAYADSRTEKERILASADEGAGGQIEDQAPVDLRVEAEVEVIESLVGIPESGLLAPPFEQAIGAAGEFIGDQARDQVDRRHGFGLSLMQPGFQHGGHAAQAKLPQRTLQFNEIHDSFSSLVFSAMKSRYRVSWRISGST